MSLIRYAGFVGGTYAGRSGTPANDRCINLYPESTKGAADAESPSVLLGTPGTSIFSALPTTPVQAVYAEPNTGNLYVVSGNTIYLVKSDGTFKMFPVFVSGTETDLTVGDGPYTFASNGTQVMLAAAGSATGYIIDTDPSTTLALKITAAGFLGCTQVAMIDNYFITIVPNSREFQISAFADGTQWDALDIGLAEGGPGNLVGMVADHRELWLFGSERAEIFIDTGAAFFPFERINSVYVEQGLAAADSLIQLDNTIYWLGRNAHGQARVFRNEGYNAVGVSNRSIEYFFNMYARNGGISDAKAFGYQDESGHTFYVITFPSVTCELAASGGVINGVISGATWVYDVSENQWHERQSLDAATGKLGKAKSVYHGFTYGKQLVAGGDTTGNIYEMSSDVYTDNGTPIKRTRRAPHIVDSLMTLLFKKFRLSAQVGTAPIGDFDNAVVLLASNDGGLTWSNDYRKSLGNVGEYTTTVEWRALGRAKRRVFEISTTIKAAVAWLDAFLDVSEGTK